MVSLEITSFGDEVEDSAIFKGLYSITSPVTTVSSGAVSGMKLR